MATEVILPALGMAQDTGTVVRWLKAQGEQVMRGEPLLEIETDKAAVEVEAPASGRLDQIMAVAGDEVPVGQVIALILTPEDVLAPAAQHPEAETVSQPPAQPLPAVEAASEPVVQRRDREVPAQAEPASLSTVLASPKARRLAREQGKDLGAIRGTGPQSAVLAADVLVASSKSVNGASPLASPRLTDDAAPTLSTIWRIMAERTTQSWTSVPHFSLVREVSAGQLVTWHAQLVRQGAREVTYTDLLVKLVAASLRLHPRLNATWHEDRLALDKDIHLGLAVAVDEGLVVPVIHEADTLDVRALARRREELLGKARAGKLRPQDIRGGTFTISNLGMYGVDAFNAIINPPQVAILAVGRIVERVVPVNSRPEIQPMLTLTLSCDHRAVDGARGAQFLKTVAELIEQPADFPG